jgi:hypothetical protein
MQEMNVILFSQTEEKKDTRREAAGSPCFITLYQTLQGERTPII